METEAASTTGQQPRRWAPASAARAAAKGLKRRRAPAVAAASCLIAAGLAAPFLLTSSSSSDGEMRGPLGLSYSLKDGGASGGGGASVLACPPGMIYGLRPKRGTEAGGEGPGGGAGPPPPPPPSSSLLRRGLGLGLGLLGRGSSPAALVVETATGEEKIMEMGCNAATRIDEEDNSCLNALPYGALHDSRLSEVVSYQEYELNAASAFADDVDDSGAGAVAVAGTGTTAAATTPGSWRWGRYYAYDGSLPDTATMPAGSSFANWDCRVLWGKKACDGADRSVDGIRRVRSSAWTSEGEDVRFVEEKTTKWVAHRDYGRLAAHEHAPPRLVLEGGVDAVAHAGFQPKNFGHILHDNLPVLAWLRSVVPASTVFLLPDTDNFRALLEFVDPDFARSRVRWYLPNQVVTVGDGGTLTVSNQNVIVAQLGNTLWRYLRRWIAETHPVRRLDPEERTVIYYARGNVPDESAAARLGAEAEKQRGEASAGTKHGRVLDPRHELDIVSTIRSAIERHGIRQELVFFTGTDSDGNILSYQEQLETFRRASTIIGPHGSGLANIVWTDPFPRGGCEERVKVLEFITGTETGKIQDSFNGYYWNMRGLPVEWHQVVYAANSTGDATYIRLTDLEDALDDMWGGGNAGT